MSDDSRQGGKEMKKAEIIAELQKLKDEGVEVEFDEKSNKADLEKILKEKRAELEPPPGACDTYGEHDGNSQYCQACEKEEPAAYAACVETTARAASAKKKAAGARKGGGRRSIATFEELKKVVVEDDTDRMTIFIDQLLLEGGVMGELLKITTEEQTKRGGGRYKTITNLYQHVNARVREGWIFEVDGEVHDGQIKKDSFKGEAKVVAVGYQKAA